MKRFESDYNKFTSNIKGCTTAETVIITYLRDFRDAPKKGKLCLVVSRRMALRKPEVVRTSTSISRHVRFRENRERIVQTSRWVENPKRKLGLFGRF